MKKMKKILAVILSLAMVLGMSITAFAATNKTSIVVNKLDKDARLFDQIWNSRQVGNLLMLDMQMHLEVKM